MRSRWHIRGVGKEARVGGKKKSGGKPMDTEQVEQWQELSEEILSGMRDWRVAHKRATLNEIEAALDERLWRLRARMLADVAMASEAVEGAGGTAVCPQCGAEVQMKGQKHERRLQTQGGREIVLEREHGVCPACGAGFFPSG